MIINNILVLILTTGVISCSTMKDSLITGIGTGAAVGVASGSMSGAKNNNQAKLTGGLVGAVIGGVSSYFLHKNRKKNEEIKYVPFHY